MGSFFTELKRRHIYRVAAAYAVVAWLLIQVVNNLAPMLHLPDWASGFFLVALLIGFPIALLFAWIHELAPGEGALGHVTTGKLDWALIGALVIVIALLSYQQLAPSQATLSAGQQKGVETAREAAASPRGAISIAVLPFVNLSSDPEQEFFSDGITEEITSALSKVSDLRIVARTSAFEFKGKNVNIKTMGEQLGASHLIEGSVRKAGERVRITAQLINAEDGTHIWSENYDRNLTDIFAVQEEIARAITTSLRMPLGLKPGENLVNNRSIDQESYQQYLRAKTLVRQRFGGGGLKVLNDAIALLEQIVARNPDYAPAWALLGSANSSVPNYSPGLLGGATTSVEGIRPVVQSALSKAERAARKAIQLDPNLADGYRTLATTRGRAGKLLDEDELRSKALSLDPSEADTLSGYANFLAVVGRVKEALTVSQQVHELEPFIPIHNRDLAVILWLNGQDDAAIEIFRRIGPNSGLIAVIQAAAGHYDEAADTLMMGPVARQNPVDTAEVVRLLRMAPAKIASPQNVKRLGLGDFVYLYVGAPEQALQNYEINLEAGWTNFANRLLSHPSYGPMRKTERYKAFARKAGLVEYWRAKGWPEFCHPTTGDDFACN
jgi:TolB-like protein